MGSFLLFHRTAYKYTETVELYSLETERLIVNNSKSKSLNPCWKFIQFCELRF